MSACYMNELKKFPDIWIESSFGADRLTLGRKLIPKELFEYLQTTVKKNAKVGVKCPYPCPIYHIMLTRRDLTYVLLQDGGDDSNKYSLEYLICIEIDCANKGAMDYKNVFFYSGKNKVKKVQLYVLK